MSTSAETSPTPEAAELLLALLGDREVVIRANEATWMSVAREAARQGVLPQLYERTRKLPGGTVPPAVAAAMRDRYVMLALQSALIFRELEAITSALVARGIPVLLLKGVHLAADVYEVPAMRTMVDIDIMVPREQLADAAQALANAGFDYAPVDDLDEFCRSNSHLPTIMPPNDRGIGVEVHWTIELPTSPFDIRPAELWASARQLRIKDAQVLGLSPEHLLLHLCLHACYHHKFDHTPLKQLCDIAATLRRYREELDWQLLAGTAERWGVQSFVRFTLILAHEMLGCEVPDTIRSLPADPDEAGVLANARAYILNCTVATPVALTRLVRARSWSKRLRATVVNVFPPPGRIAAIYGLPPDSPRLLLYYLIRPFDLLRRKGMLTLELILPSRTGRRMRYAERNRTQLKVSLRQWAQSAESVGNKT